MAARLRTREETSKSVKYPQEVIFPGAQRERRAAGARSGFRGIARLPIRSGSKTTRSAMQPTSETAITLHRVAGTG
jgi:hypothetical protein